MINIKQCCQPTFLVNTPEVSSTLLEEADFPSDHKVLCFSVKPERKLLTRKRYVRGFKAADFNVIVEQQLSVSRLTNAVCTCSSIFYYRVLFLMLHIHVHVFVQVGTI